MAGKLIRAFYDYDCVWDEWSNPEQFAKFKDEKDELGYIFGEPMENDGVRYVKNELRGSDAALKEVERLQSELEKLRWIPVSEDEPAAGDIVDFVLQGREFGQLQIKAGYVWREELFDDYSPDFEVTHWRLVTFPEAE